MRLNYFKLFFLWALFLNFKTSAQTDAQLEKRIDAIFNTRTADKPGASVAVIKKGKIIFNKGYGSANLDYRIAIDSHSVFDVASLTKHFTAFSILLLEEKGALNLSDEVVKYIEDFPFKNKHITVEQLLYHTSGIRDYIHMQKAAGLPFSDDYTNGIILNEFKKQENLNFEPGSSILYSNTNYLLLAEIVKKVSGISLDTFCSQFIFKPIGMSNTVFLNNHPIRGRVLAYEKTGENSYEGYLNTGSVAGPVGVYSTPVDIAKWLNNLSTETIGGKKVIDKFLASTELSDGTFINNKSCVLGKKTYHDQNLYLSNGDWPGYKSQVFYFPDQQIGIVVLSNSGNDLNVYTSSCHIADILLEKEAANPKLNKQLKKTISMRSVNRFEGDYDLGLGFKVSVKEMNHRLKLKSTWDQDYLEMIPIDSNAFLVDHDDYRNREIRFVYDTKEKNYVFVYNHIDRGYQYVYTARQKEYLKQFEGMYYAKEAGTTYTMALKDSVLQVSHFVNPELTLKPMKDDVFEVGEWWFDKVEFTRNEEGLIMGFNLTLDRINRLAFVKIVTTN